MENIALQSSQIFYVFVLRVEIVTVFEPKVVTIPARNTICRKVANFVRLYFPHITIFSTWNFITFKRFFPGISFLLTISKISLLCKLFISDGHILKLLCSLSLLTDSNGETE